MLLIKQDAESGKRIPYFFCFKNMIPVIFKNYYETGLYWCLLPDKTHAVSGEICTGGKKSKERITLLDRANMTGTKKLPFLAIAKFKTRGVSRNPNSSC